MLKNFFTKLHNNYIAKLERQNREQQIIALDHLFWGENKNVEVKEDNLNYTYTHHECFLIKDPQNLENTVAKQLTGDNAGSVFVIKTDEQGRPFVHDSIGNTQIKFYITHRLYESAFVPCSLSLKSIAQTADTHNRLSKGHFKEKALAQQAINAEFENE